MSAPAADASDKKGLLKSLAPFPKPFWVINGVEFLERGAYYGMLSVLSVFLLNDIGTPSWFTGVLLAIQFPLLYFLPVVAGALAEKFGFRTLLVFSFVALIGGYLSIATATAWPSVLLGVVLYGLGAGAFKPIPAATVAHTTSEETRNFGFALYYWFINAGAFLVPTLLAVGFGGSFRTYFWTAALVSIVNLLLSAFVWKNVVPANKGVKVGAALKGMGELFRYPAFMVLLLIYSGFWFMYAMTTSFLQAYVVEFDIMDPAYVALLVPLNALAIIVLGPLLGKFTDKAPSLPLMIGGITIYVLGFILLGFTTITWVVLLAVVIYSAGEFLTHPGFLSYVSKIAPADRVAVFMGYGFFPVGIGLTIGTLTGGFLYGRFAQQSGQPQLFWALMSSVGLLTVAALLIYNRALQRKSEGVVPATPAARTKRGFLTGPTLALLALLAVPALVAAGAFAPSPVAAAGADVEPLGTTDLTTAKLDPLQGTTQEGTITTQTVALPESATGLATFTLTWRDEAAGPGETNAPDKFRIRVTTPEGETVESKAVSNSPGGEGRIEVELEGARPGDHVVEVELLSAGDRTIVSIVPVGGSQDASNSWQLAVEYQTRA